jgi:branched-chain amino acid aminotransferase
MAWDDGNLKIWMDGELVDWKDAKIHVLSHVIHYGSAVFEGVRCYNNKNGSAVFRLNDHVKRLFNSAKIYKMPIPYTQEEIGNAIKNTIKTNELKSCYVRPIVYRGYKELGVTPLNCPVNTTIAVWEWGSYLGEEGMKNGVNVGVSSWRKPAPDTLPTLAKAAANYMNSQLAKIEATENGFDECIQLDQYGHIGEGSGENIFLVKDETLYTPTLSSSVLDGITRASIIQIAKDLGYEVVERSLQRESLYLADEIFFTGSAAEVTPIRSVDGREVGIGSRGPITEKIQSKFFDIVEGRAEDKYNWLNYID